MTWIILLSPELISFPDRRSGWCICSRVYKSIPVYNQLHVLAFKNDKLVSVAGSRIAAIEQKISNDRSTPAITAIDAVQTAAAESKVNIQEMIIPVNILQEEVKNLNLEDWVFPPKIFLQN